MNQKKKCYPLSEKDGLDVKNRNKTDHSKDVAEASDTGQVDQSTEASLRERVKELACLYGITQHIMQNYKSPYDVFPGIVEYIPSAWQYPEITVGRIFIDGHTYSTSSFEKICDKQVSEIIVNGRKRGKVEVIYTKKMPGIYEGPFLKEERNLVDAIAKQVALTIERRETEKEKNELQKQLMHADRLATIGQLAAGVAHELNEPLGNILGFAQLALKCPQLPEQAGQDIDKIVTASLYVREIIKKLLLFARQTPTMKTVVDLNKVVKDALGLFKGRCEKEGIEIETLLSSDLPEITADPGQINQVLVNLIVNAIQAMPKGGRLTIQTYTKNEHIFIKVKDTGIGMSKEVQERIFIPFFTTKDVSQGTGLGLAVVHGIITLHGGSIDVKSQPGVGTSFTIKLPVIGQNLTEVNDNYE